MSDTKSLGRFTFVLHSHLPYVLSHGRWPHGMVWLSEAAAETYIPLWRSFKKLHEQGKKLAVTIGITPVLAEQLSDETFVREFLDYLEMKRRAARVDLEDFIERGETRMAEVAQFWIDWYAEVEKDFREELHMDIVQGFRKLQDDGAIEIITCAATHGYLPLLGTDEAVEAQIKIGVETYKKHFGRDPQGIWLPECAFRPGYHWIPPEGDASEGFDRTGVEQYLKKYGIRYFIVDTHLLKGGKAMGVYLNRFEGLRQLWEQAESGLKEVVRDEDVEKVPYRPYWVAHTTKDGEPVGVLTRDPKTSLQVWSGEYGYPGDGNYLDFHKKHFPGGHRYWRVTRAQADLGEKELYDLAPIAQRQRENADHFVSLLTSVLKENDGVPVNDRMVMTPFDTELFGHWWFEGPGWLEHVLSTVDDISELTPSTGSEIMSAPDQAPVVELPEGSWGEGGFHYIWYNDETKWTWPEIYRCERRMTEAVRKYGEQRGDVYEALQQLGRELLLMESSDWQFLISTVAAKDYAELRFTQHVRDFDFVSEVVDKLADGRGLTGEEWERYQAIRERDVLFEDIDPSIWG